MCASVCECVQVCVEVCGYLRVCMLDEFTEYLLETRVNTSADFNTYPIRIFYISYKSFLKSSSFSSFFASFLHGFKNLEHCIFFCVLFSFKNIS